MRIILLILASISFLTPKAQAVLPVTTMSYTQWLPFPSYKPLSDANGLNQKWYFNTYTGISAGTVFFNGGGATFLSVPVGLQLTRQLNNNLYAFAGVSAGPAIYSFNRSFMDPVLNKSYPGIYQPNAYSFGMNAGVQMGLMYVNDAKTFSISGSIGIERGSYPVYQSGGLNTKKQ